MNELRIYGASDDLLELSGAFDEEYENPNGEFVVLISGESEALLVYARFLTSGTWSIGVAPCDDDSALPVWPMRIERGGPSECHYSPTLVIDVPDGFDVAVTT